MTNEEKTQKEQPKRYNEKEIIKKFLVSQKGITFLIDNVRDRKKESQEGIPRDEMTNQRQVDNIVDYYFAWINTFPIKRNMRMSKYAFLKHLEDFCQKNNIGDMFNFLFM